MYEKNEHISAFSHIPVNTIKEPLFEVEYCKPTYICMREIFVKFLRSSLVAVNISHCEPFLVIYGTCFNNTNLHKAWSQKLVVMNQFSPVHSKFFSI